jgi:hypothetical protein
VSWVSAKANSFVVGHKSNKGKPSQEAIGVSWVGSKGDSFVVGRETNKEGKTVGFGTNRTPSEKKTQWAYNNLN